MQLRMNMRSGIWRVSIETAGVVHRPRRQGSGQAGGNNLNLNLNGGLWHEVHVFPVTCNGNDHSPGEGK
jgi:hypothetical protein